MTWYVPLMSQYIKTDPSQTINGEMKYRCELSLPALGLGSREKLYEK